MSVRHAVERDNPCPTAPIWRIFWPNACPMAVVLSLTGLRAGREVTA